MQELRKNNKFRNGFIDVIESCGLKPSLFEPSDKANVDGHPAFILTLKDSGLSFLARTCSSDQRRHDYKFIIYGADYNWSNYMPRSRSGMEYIYPQDRIGSPEESCSATDVYTAFTSWLEDHVKPYLRELETPNLWEQIAKQDIVKFDPRIRDENEFNEDEKKEYRASIAKFHQLILTTYHPNDECQKQIQDQLDYLTERVDKLNKFDWCGVAIQILIGISIQLAFNEESRRQLFDLFKECFSAFHLLN
ncbi:hypothetical protein JXA32_09645 [Candidatus Sumerlaeota bacterium]|nr:hypothetical protein [Candidatus Sumerlaeota bacterium]